jgi:hypothetical protein
MFITAWAGAATSILPGADRPLEERFANPPGEARILKIMHTPKDTPEDCAAFIQDLLEKGFGGMATNVNFDGYVESPERWTQFLEEVKQAKAAGMSLWLYDEMGYPSGNAGGITLRDHPEWEARGLLANDVQGSGALSLDVPPGRLVRVAAFPVRDGVLDESGAVELTEAAKDKTTFSWQAPDGVWRIIAIGEDRLYEGTHATANVYKHQPYINLLMAEPTAKFIAVTHDQYAAHLGGDFGKTFESTFTDEPSLMSVFIKAMPWKPLPWSPGFSEEFKKRRGYAIEPHLAALVAETGPQGQAARYDFWQTVAELVSTNYFGQLRTWCRAHGTQSGGHLLYEEPLITHTPFYGDFFRCARALDAPSIDCLTSVPKEVPWFIGRLLSSAGELEGRKDVMCEMSDFAQVYRPEGDTRPVRAVTEDEIRGACNRLIVNGVNTFTSYYSFRDLSNEQLVRINEWIGRCCTMLKGGRQATEIALLYPAETLWAHFTPSRHMVDDISEDLKSVEHAWRGTEDALYATRHDFTIVDSRTLCEGAVENGALRYGPHRWRAIVLPGVDTLPLAAWEKLYAFWQSGGMVLSTHPFLPTNSEKDFPCARVREIGQALFGGNGQGKAFQVLLDKGLPETALRELPADAHTTRADSPLRITHRSIDGHAVYFIINDSGEAVEEEVTAPFDGPGEQWDPASGAHSAIASGKAIPVKLEPYGGVFFRFAEGG